jgi:hypothetical protein
MSFEFRIAKLQVDRQTEGNRLTTLEAERDLASSPSGRETICFKIRTLNQHILILTPSWTHCWPTTLCTHVVCPRKKQFLKLRLATSS